ncbi:unnamed protein product [Absidia cylindrospora]
MDTDSTSGEPSEIDQTTIPEAEPSVAPLLPPPSKFTPGTDDDTTGDQMPPATAAHTETAQSDNTVEQPPALQQTEIQSPPKSLSHEGERLETRQSDMDVDMPDASSESTTHQPVEKSEQLQNDETVPSLTAESTTMDTAHVPSDNTISSPKDATATSATIMEDQKTQTKNITTTTSTTTEDQRPPSATKTTAEDSTPSAATAATTSSNNNNATASQNGYRPLNVKDALTYLDQVKVQFSEHPEVYNKFLDIMKDFKSQAIDTPGVIERVSTLFRGHPLLISGFNTFLPPGYCIECITDENANDIIKVTTPTGTTTTNAGEPLRLGSETTGTPTHEQLYYGTAAGGYGGYGGTGRTTTTTTTMYTDRNGTPITTHHLQHPGQPPSVTGSHQLHHQQQQQQQQQPHHLQHPHTAGQQPFHHPTEDGMGNRRAPVEFNHAINYVNKIKNRFSSDPDIYKQFLEILQTYQKEQRPIQEVYGQVQVLFNGDSELLAEFKQFLPDTTGGASTAVYTSTPQGRKGLMMVPGLPNVSQGRKKRGPSMLASGLSKRSKLQNKMDTQTSEVRSGMSLDQEMMRPFVSGEEVEFFERVKKYIGSKVTYNAFLKVLNLFSQQIVDQNVLVNRVEGFIGGNKDLFDMFKTLVGYDGKDEMVENVPADMDKPDLSRCRACGPSYRLIPKSWEQSQICSGKDELCLEVLNNKYVSHPTWASEDSGNVASKKNQYEEALHRVEEERYDYDLNIEANLNTIALLEPIMKKISVMNPEEKMEFTLAVGLGGPSKTIYQRIIKKIYGNEKGLQVIGLLHSSPAQTVPIVLKRLKQKDDEWKRAQREWNKIWREVEAKNYFKALDYQGITFKASDKRRITTKHLITEIEECRMQQQEDYQQQIQKVDASSALLVPARRPPQFTFDFGKKDVIKDVIRLVYYFFERTELYSTENQTKMRTFMETLLPLVFDVGSLFSDDQNDDDDDDVAAAATATNGDDGGDESMGIEDEGDDDGLGDDDEAADEADDEEDEESQSVQSYDTDDDTAGTNRKSSRSTRGNAKKNFGNRRTLKDILTENIRQQSTSLQPLQQTTTDATSAAADTDATLPSDSENGSNKQIQQETDVDVPDANDPPETTTSQTATAAVTDGDSTSLSKADQDSTSSTSNKRHVYNLFGDSEFYCFFRLYQLIYDRLCQMKALDELYKKDPTKTKRENKAALNLGLKSIRISGYQLSFSKGYYQALLTLIEKFFEGDLDQQSFEEISRYIFGSKAYIMFTIDKTVLALIRHTHLIVSSEKTPQLLDLFKEDRELEHVDAQILGDYRLRVENIVGKDEVLFNIAFDTTRRLLSIQILGDNEDYEKDIGDNYEEYVSSYIDWTNATKGINPSDLTPRFLKRNMKTPPGDGDGAQQQDIFVQSGMQYKICRDTYHLFYIIGSEDIFIRLPSAPSIPPQSSSSSSSPPSSSSHPSTSQWKSWLESDQGWGKGVTNKDQAESDARKLLFSNDA